jgi:hypothetical protein
MGPDFLCIGLQKAGTRWLYDQLSHAKGVWLPPIKEIGYFDKRSFKPGNMKILDAAHKFSFSFYMEGFLAKKKIFSG